MSRSGSTTKPPPRSVSATRKLLFPNSEAGTASTVYMALPERDRRGRQEDPDCEGSDHDSAAVEDHLRRYGFRGRHPKVDEQVAQSMREMEERHSDEDKKVELHNRVAEDADPGVVVAVDHRHNSERAEYALDQDVDRHEDRGDHPTLREQEPPDEVGIGGLGVLGVADIVHLANPTRTAAITAEATNHAANCDSTINRDGTPLMWMITPARLRNV